MGVEKDAFDLGFTISSLKFLDNFTSVCAVNLDNVASLRCRRNKCTIWINSNGAHFRIMSWNDQVNRLVNNVIQHLERPLILMW